MCARVCDKKTWLLYLLYIFTSFITHACAKYTRDNVLNFDCCVLCWTDYRAWAERERDERWKTHDHTWPCERQRTKCPQGTRVEKIPNIRGHVFLWVLCVTFGGFIPAAKRPQYRSIPATHEKLMLESHLEFQRSSTWYAGHEALLDTLAFIITIVKPVLISSV